MPPPPGIAELSFFGNSATIASVVIKRPAIEEASCSAMRTQQFPRLLHLALVAPETRE
jgi:hypothetical protein